MTHTVSDERTSTRVPRLPEPPGFESAHTPTLVQPAIDESIFRPAEPAPAEPAAAEPVAPDAPVIRIDEPPAALPAE